MAIYKLKDIAKVELSGVDKKTNSGEQSVRLCNFVDVYSNWAITHELYDGFMEATARPNEILRFKLKKGQVAFTKDSETRDDIGIPAYIAEDFTDVILGYHNALVTPDESRLSGKYLNALMHTEYARKYWANNASGSGQRYALSVDAIESFPVPLPPLSEQQRIGNIFSDLDKKICLNKLINQNLEASLQLLFEYTFIQNACSNWAYIPLGEYADIVNGATPSTSNEDNYGGDIVWITPKDLSDQSCKFVFHGSRNITKQGYDSCSTTIVPKGTIVMSSRAPIGLLSIAKTSLCTNQGFKSLVPKDMKSSEYLYYYIKYHIPLIQQLGTGTTFKEVSRDDMSRFKIQCPDDSTLSKWHNNVSSVFDKQFATVKEIEELTKLRDELLPLLMNGQVTVTQLNSDFLSYLKIVPIYSGIVIPNNRSLGVQR